MEKKLVDLYQGKLEVWQGEDFNGNCPFHNDVKKNFIIYTDENVWTCLEGCGSRASVAEFERMSRLANPVSYQDLCNTFDKWLLLPDKNVIKVLLATLMAHFFTTDPLWMFFVAPPSGSKTEIISTAAFLPFCHLLSDLTPQTLASGMPIKNGKDPSLLSKLKDNVLVMKDFTTVLSMRADDRGMILSQLREVYDGRYSKSFGTGKTVEWEGRLSLIAGVTTIIDTHNAVFQVMGERFLMYRIPQADAEDVAMKALSNFGGEKEMRAELKKAMETYFEGLEKIPVDKIEVPMEIKKALAALSTFVVTARSGILRDNYRKEIDFIPDVEAPSRFAKQIGTLIKALAVIEGRRVVEWKDYYLTLKVALDVIPGNRMKHLIAMCGEKFLIQTKVVADRTRYSINGAERNLEDLYALGLLTRTNNGIGNPQEWGISELSQSFFKKILPKDDPLLYTVFPDHLSPYIPLIKQMIGDVVAEEKIKDSLELMGFPNNN
jgi:hypothetical protein